MVTQMQLKVLFGRTIAWPPGRLEREREKKSRAFFDVISDVYTHVDNRDRARTSD